MQGGAPTEALTDEKAVTAIGFMHRARVFFAAHGIIHIERIVTDNGSCYRAKNSAKVLHGARHQRITPYTPRHKGKVERYNRILADDFLYAREWTSEQQRSDALGVWNVHYNYHRPHTAAGNRPPASKLRDGVTNVLTSYSRNLHVLTDSLHAAGLLAAEGSVGSDDGEVTAIVQRIRHSMLDRKARFSWVRGHSGHPLSECAYRLALTARRGHESQIDMAVQRALATSIVAKLVDVA